MQAVPAEVARLTVAWLVALIGLLAAGGLLLDPQRQEDLRALASGRKRRPPGAPAPDRARIRKVAIGVLILTAITLVGVMVRAVLLLLSLLVPRW